MEVCLGAFSMVGSAFAVPPGRILSLNPQEDVQFQKEVQQVRQRVTQVSGRRGAGGEVSASRGSRPGRDLPSLGSGLPQ